MGFFSRNKKPFMNKYAAHPDVLDEMAKSLAELALKQMRENEEKTCQLALYVELGSWSIDLNSKAFESYYHALLNEYCYEYSTFGMEDVPEEDASVFLSALEPYLEKHIEDKFKKHFPKATYATVKKTTYRKEHYRDTDYDIIDVIEISISKPSTYIPPKSTLKKW